MTTDMQLDMFSVPNNVLALPTNYTPTPPDHFPVERIILTKGSVSTSERAEFVRRVCDVYPGVPVEEMLDIPHNRVDLGEKDPARLQEKGKRTLVFGELGVANAVQCNESEHLCCPYRWFFSVYGHCPYGCRYCYLSATPGVWFSPTVKIYVNLPEILCEMQRHVRCLEEPSVFYLGKFQDGLALDSLTAYSTVLVPFFAKQKHARLNIQTKSVSVERLLNLEHEGNTTLIWTLNPPEIARLYEINAPAVTERLDAMARCAERAYPVWSIIEPVIPHGNWEEMYTDLVSDLLQRMPVQRLALGGISLCDRSLSLLEKRMGERNVISCSLLRSRESETMYYRPGIFDGLFRRILDIAKEIGAYRSERERDILVIEFDQEQ
ncbi:radical SAM protein [Candidatus Hydrogenedentota bacterium]